MKKVICLIFCLLLTISGQVAFSEEENYYNIDIPSCNELRISYYKGGEFPDAIESLYYCYETTNVDEIKNILNALKDIKLIPLGGGFGASGGESLSIYADDNEVIRFLFSSTKDSLCSTPDEYYICPLEECRKLEDIILEHKHKNDIQIYFDNKKINFYNSPIIIDGRTLISIDEIEEQLGVSAGLASNDEVYVRNSKKELIFVMDKNIVYENGVSQPIDVGCKKINHLAKLPLRKIAEYFGYSVTWENDSVYISSK